MKPHLMCTHGCGRRWVRTVDGQRTCTWCPDRTPPPLYAGGALDEPHNGQQRLGAKGQRMRGMFGGAS